MDFTNIKDKVIDETIDYLQNNYKPQIEIISSHLKDYVKELLESEFINMDREAKMKKTSLQIYRAKKRWLDKSLVEYAKYTENLLPIKKVKIYAKLVERYHNKLIEEVQTWQQDSSKFLLSFPCFDILTNAQRNLAIEKDTIMFMGEILKREEKNQTKVYESVNSLIDINMFSSGKKNSVLVNKKKKLTDNGNTLFLVDKLPGLPKNIESSMYVDERFLNDLNAMVPDLNTQDYELFTEILQFRDYRFKQTRTIEVPLRTLAEITFGKLKFSKKHYEIIENRLLKLSFYREVHKDDNGDIHSYGALSDVNIITVDDVRYAKCTVSDLVFNAFLNHEITAIYSAELPKLKGSIAYKLVFYLQKERLVAYQAGINNPVKFEYYRFFDTVRLIGRTKKEKIKEISNALTQIKSLGIILEDYYLSGSSYFLTFVPLSKEELQGHNIPIATQSTIGNNL